MQDAKAGRERRAKGLGGERACTCTWAEARDPRARSQPQLSQLSAGSRPSGFAAAASFLHTRLPQAATGGAFARPRRRRRRTAHTPPRRELHVTIEMKCAAN